MLANTCHGRNCNTLLVGCKSNNNNTDASENGQFLIKLNILIMWPSNTIRRYLPERSENICLPSFVCKCSLMFYSLWPKSKTIHMSNHCDILVQWNANSAMNTVNTVMGWILEEHKEDENRHRREHMPFVGICRKESMMESTITGR